MLPKLVFGTLREFSNTFEFSETMGLMRGGLFTIVSVLFLVAVIATLTCMTISSSLDYESAKPQLTESLKKVADQEMGLNQNIEQVYPTILQECENKTEYSYAHENYNFNIPCTTIQQGINETIDYGISQALEQAYYKEYDCGFWDCFTKTQSPEFLISEKAQEYWHGKFILFLFIAIILLVAMFFVAEKKSNAFIVAGILTLVVSVPFIKLASMPFIKNTIASILFTNSYSSFISALLIGILLIAIGIVIKFFGIGFSLQNFFHKKAQNNKIKELEERVNKERKAVNGMKKGKKV